MTMPPGLCIR